MKKHQWFKFDAAAWLSDPHLRMCGPASHGLLINLIAIAHGADPYGYLINGGLIIDADNIAKVLGWNKQTVKKAWAELEQNGRIMGAQQGQDGGTTVAPRQHNGSTTVAQPPLWYIPRMVKDHEQAIIDRLNGVKGGNPALLGDNPPLKAEKSRVDKSRVDKIIPPTPKGETPPKQKRKPFIKPTLKELTEYIETENAGINAAQFINHYESNGWKVGRNKMKDWKAAVGTWKRNAYTNGNGNSKNAHHEIEPDAAAKWTEHLKT